MLTQGVAEEDFDENAWNNENIGWLSILGYNGYLINPVVDSLAYDPMTKYQWIPAVEFTEGALSISESGNYDQYSLSWAGNISNQWYVGVALNIFIKMMSTVSTTLFIIIATLSAFIGIAF